MSEIDNNVMPLAEDPHNLGEFDNVYQAMRRYPNGGTEDDYIYILGVKHFWNANRQSWGILKDKEDNLVQMVEDFIMLFYNKGYSFAGIAHPDTEPSEYDGVFYIAAENGTYVNFGNNIKVENEVAIISKARKGDWVKTAVAIPNNERIDEIDSLITTIQETLQAHAQAIVGIEGDIDNLYDSIDETNQDLAELGQTVEEYKELNDKKDGEQDERIDDVEERLEYIPKESFLSSEPASGYHEEDNVEELTADRAMRDRFGRMIDEEYLTRDAAKNYTQEVVDGSKLEIMPGSVKPEDLSPAVQEMIEAGAGKPGNITNLPDEEDLTVSENNVLKLKDKEYNPYNYSGMGRVYLRKHIVNGTNILAQHMINKPNTIYIIQYDYCLGGETIEIPENCVLQFEGGSLRNGSIKGNNTILKASPVKIFDNIIIKNTWNVSESYLEWFGAYGDGIHDDTLSIKSCLIFKNIRLLNKYKVRDVELYDDIRITGGELIAFVDEYRNTRNIIFTYKEINVEFWGVNFNGSVERRGLLNGELINMIKLYNCKKVIFEKCDIHNHGQQHSTDDEEWAKRNIYAVNIFEADNVIFNGCCFYKNNTEQISIGSYIKNTFLTISNCKCYDNTNAYGLFLLFNVAKTIVTNNMFMNNGRTFLSMFCNNVIISNNIFDGTTSRAVTSEDTGTFYNMSNILVINNIVKNCKEGGINTGINNCIVKNNYIENCANPIICKAAGFSDGELMDVTKKALPYAKFTFSNQENLIVENNNIVDCYGDMAIKIMAQTNRINDAVEGGSMSNIFIRRNLLKHNCIYSIRLMYCVNIDNIEISSNTIEQLNSKKPVVATYNTLDCILNKIKIADNQCKTLDKYFYRNVFRLEVKSAENIIVTDNITYSCCESDFFTVAVGCSIGKIINISNNETLGAEQCPTSTSLYKENFAYLPYKRLNSKSSIYLNEGETYVIGDYVEGKMIGSSFYGGNIAKRIQRSGTYGELNGVTGSISNGLLIVNDSSNLKIGQHLLLNDSIKCRILYIEGNTIYTTLTTDTNIEDVVVKYSNPEFYTCNYSSKMSSEYDKSESLIRYNQSLKALQISDGEEYVDVYGVKYSDKKGTYENIPTVANGSYRVGQFYFNTSSNKTNFYNGEKWVDANGNDFNVKYNGKFTDKPENPMIGFEYFCTDKQTTEGVTNGIMIYHKGNNVWVDALGRVVS